jgi:hypothetical protein
MPYRDCSGRESQQETCRRPGVVGTAIAARREQPGKRRSSVYVIMLRLRLLRTPGWSAPSVAACGRRRRMRQIEVWMRLATDESGLRRTRNLRRCADQVACSGSRAAGCRAWASQKAFGLFVKLASDMASAPMQSRAPCIRLLPGREKTGVRGRRSARQDRSPVAPCVAHTAPLGSISYELGMHVAHMPAKLSVEEERATFGMEVAAICRQACKRSKPERLETSNYLGGARRGRWRFCSLIGP